MRASFQQLHPTKKKSCEPLGVGCTTNLWVSILQKRGPLNQGVLVILVCGLIKNLIRNYHVCPRYVVLAQLTLGGHNQQKWGLSTDLRWQHCPDETALEALHAKGFPNRLV